MFNSPGYISKKFPISIIFAVLFIMSFATIVIAAEYGIDTNDGSVSEWATYGIPVFQTSPNDGTIDDNMDIKNASVARGDDGNLYFMMETYGSDPIVTTDTAAVAIIDCDRDHVIEDPDDRVAVYIRNGSGGFLGLPSDAVYITSGDYDLRGTPGGSEQGNHDLGQRTGQYVEWGITLADLPLSDSLPANYCQDVIVDIKFTTADVVVGGSIFNPTLTVTFVDDTGTFDSFNVPTAISLQAFQVDSREAMIPAFLLLAIGFAFVSGGIVWIKRR